MTVKFLLIGKHLELPSLNVWDKWHWTKQGEFKQALALYLKVQKLSRYRGIGFPFVRAKITINSYRQQLIRDTYDNVAGCLKPLLDAMQPPMKVKPTVRYPDGIKASWRANIIAGDDRKSIEVIFNQFVDQKNRRTEIILEEL